MHKTIPQCSPLAGFAERRRELETAALRVLRGGRYILGEEVAAFEEEFATANGSGACVGVASGTDALELILRALDLPPNSLVLTAPNTAVATAAAVDRAGCQVCFADADDTLTLSPEAVRVAFERSTRPIAAVIGVHLFGNPCNAPEIKKICDSNGACFIEDCAQAAGARLCGVNVGNFGVAGAFSFYPTKNLAAFGDGGAVVTNSPQLAERLRLLRQYGWRTRYESGEKGINSRLDEIQAAMLRVSLKYLDADNARRRAIAEIYRNELSGSGRLPATLPGACHVYHQFVLEANDRQKISERLAANGVGTMIHYPLPVHLQPAYAAAPRLTPLAVCERSCASIISLPIYPQLEPEDARRAAELFRGVAG